MDNEKPILLAFLASSAFRNGLCVYKTKSILCQILKANRRVLPDSLRYSTSVISHKSWQASFATDANYIH